MKKRTLYFDVLNVAACLAVIGNHHNSIVHTYSNSLTWKTALLANNATCWGAVAFFMLTGATLMNYREKYDTKTFFKNRFFRTMIPFAAWSIIMLVWKVVTGQYTLEDGSAIEIIDVLLNHDMEDIYWFMPMLFSFYLLMPLLSWLTEPKHRPTIRYLIIGLFISPAVLSPLCTLVGVNWNTYYGIALSAYSIYVLLGYYLSTEKLEKKVRYWIYGGGVAGLIIRFGGIFLLSTRDGVKNNLFFSQGTFPTVMIATAVFVWVKQVNWERVLSKIHVTPQVMAKLSAYSFGIYLTHKIVMYYELNWLAQWGITNRNVFWRTIWIPVTYLLALALVALLKKIPGVRRIVP